MNTIQQNNAMLDTMQERAWGKFYAKCQEWNLSDTSVAALLGVSRQTIINYKDVEKRPPCLGAMMRIKMVIPLLEKAESNALLPAESRNKQSDLVEQILGQ